jgi:bacterioferritin (cytochrome b1)
MSSKGVEKMSRSSEEMDDEQLPTIDDLEMLGEDLVGELRAINQYHGHVLVLENEEAVTAPEHIREGARCRVAETDSEVRALLRPVNFEEIL